MATLSAMSITCTTLASIRPRSRVVRLVSEDVTWSSRANPYPTALKELAKIEAEIASFVASLGLAATGIIVEVAGLARVSAGTSGRYTAVIVLVASPDYPSRVVILPTE